MSLLERDKQAIWHPFTQMKTSPRHVPVIKGDGAVLTDENGKEYIDAVSSWWVNIHGHSHPYIADKVHDQFQQLEHVIFAGFTHEPAVRLGERLLSHLPANQNKIFYSDNGSTATEVGVKMAFQYWYNIGQQKTRIVAFKDAYHGDTFGAMSVSGRSPFNNPFAPFLFDVEYIDLPHHGKEQQSIEQFKELVKTEDVAAFIFEPLVQGVGGMSMYDREPLDELLSICQEHNVLAIADEVMTGFYRTGEFLATDHLRTNPDMICLSKGLTGGSLPMGITSCTQEIYEAFLSEDKMKTFFHGHSYTANPLACAAANASLDLLEQESRLNDIKRIVESHRAFAKELDQEEQVSNVRQWGTILAFDVKTGEGTTYFSNLRDTIYEFFMERGFLLRPLGNTIYIMPPYCITDDQLQGVYYVIRWFFTWLREQSEDKK
jgi:adenosylmethionine-8-amino-7-oxononanoate aminotransferase